MSSSIYWPSQKATPVKNPKVAEQMNEMHDKWFNRKFKGATA